MMHIPESSRGEAFHPLFVIAPSCQQSAPHLSHSQVRLFQKRSGDGSRGGKRGSRALYRGKRVRASRSNSALSRGIIDPDLLLRLLIREASPSASGSSGLSCNVEILRYFPRGDVLTRRQVRMSLSRGTAWSFFPVRAL